jgi:hypothetical protein
VKRLGRRVIDDSYDAWDVMCQYEAVTPVAAKGSPAEEAQIAPEKMQEQVAALSDLSANTELSQSTSPLQSVSASGADVQPASPSDAAMHEGAGTDPYDNFSDVTSIISSYDGLEEDEGAEAFRYALASCVAGEPVDFDSIVQAMEVWLDLAFFDSQTLPRIRKWGLSSGGHRPVWEAPEPLSASRASQTARFSPEHMLYLLMLLCQISGAR